MKRSLSVIILIGLVFGIMAIAHAAPLAPRAGGCCVWANGKVYWYLGQSDAQTDLSGKTYNMRYAAAGISVFTPNTGVGSWESSKFNHTGPLGWDSDANGLCEWSPDLQGTGAWTQENAGAAWDVDGDGVKEIFAFFGWGRSDIWKYDPPTTANPRGTWACYDTLSSWTSFRRGAVAQDGSKVYLCSGAGSGGFMCYDLAAPVGSNTRYFVNPGPTTQRCNTTIVDHKMYIVGGTGTTSVWMADLTQAEPSFNVVASIPDASITQLEMPQVVSYNHKVYVISGKPSDKMYVLNTSNNTWAPTVTLPFTKFSGGAAVDPATGMVYVGGGGTGGTDPAWPAVLERSWYKADLNSATPTFARVADDPAYIPYDDWAPEVEFHGTVTDQAGNPIKYALVNVGDSLNYNRYLTSADGTYTVSMLATAVAGKSSVLLTADAWQYANKDMLVPVNQVAPVNIKLDAKVETSPIPNSDFEIIDSTSGLPTNWLCEKDATDWAWSASTENHPTTVAGHSLQVSGPNVGYTGYGTYSDVFPVAGGSVYNLNVWRHRTGGTNVGEMYWFYNADGGEVYGSGWNTGDRHPNSSVMEGNWFRLDAKQTMYRIQAPADAVSMKVYFAGDSWTEETCMIDDVQLEEVTAVFGNATGRVVDATGNGVEGAYVCYKGSELATMDAGKKDFAVTDADGYYTINLPIGEYRLAAFKEGYRPSADTAITLQGTMSIGNIVLQPGKDDLLAQRDDLLNVSSTMPESNLYYAVDGDHSTAWQSVDPSPEGAEWEPQYMIAAFDQASDISDIVIYRQSAKRYGNDDLFHSYVVDVMTSGTPSDPLSWDDPTSTVTTIYTKYQSTYGAEIQPGVGLCAMPLDIKQALGIRIRFSEMHWWASYAQISDLEVHGVGPYSSFKTIADLKNQPVETKVAMGGKQLTAVCATNGDEALGVPANTAYCEETDRSSGIRLDVSGCDLTLVQMGEGVTPIVGVVGTVKKTSAGEKYIKCDKIRWIKDQTSIAPLGMNNRFSATTLATGLYVKVWGTATKIGEDGYRAIYTLDDGSGTPITLYSYYQSIIPASTLITARGVLSTDGTNPVLYMTDPNVEY